MDEKEHQQPIEEILSEHISFSKNHDTSQLKQELSQEDKDQIIEIQSQIDLNEPSVILQYGAPVQTKISKFSDNVLQNVRTKDTGEIGNDLSTLVTTIKDFDTEADKKPRFTLFRNTKNKIDKLMINFATVESNINKIIKSLESHQRQLLKDVNMLEHMYGNNFEYFKELSLYIIAGEEKLKNYKEVDIPQQQTVAQQTQDQMEAQKLRDMSELANRFEKKLHDLKLSRTISVQMAPQIRLIQNNNTVLIEKIQSSIVNSIPLWKNQIVIALGISNSQKALQTQKEVTDMTNELLQKNSELLKQGSLAIAEEGERSVVSLETLQKTNINLIETINGVLEIQRKGSEARKSATDELIKIEEDLKQALLEASRV